MRKMDGTIPTAQVRHRARSWEMSPHLGQVVMDVESGQLGEVPVQAQGHEEARVLIGQLGVLGLIVCNPGRVDL